MKKNIYNNVPIKRYLLRKSVPLTWVGLLFLFSKITELTDCYLYVYCVFLHKETYYEIEYVTFNM